MLRDYQQQMCRNILTDVRENPDGAYVSIAATGTGKGNVIAEVACALSVSDKAPAIVMAPTEEIIDQLARHVQNAFGEDVAVGIEQGKRSTTSADSRTIVASLKTLESEERRLQVLQRAGGCVSAIVCDEAHHFATPLRREILTSLGYGHVPTVGFTATFDRSYAARELLDLFPRVSYAYHMLDAIRDAWIADVRPMSIETGISLQGVPSGSGDYNQEKLIKTINTKKRNSLAVETYLQHVAGGEMPIIAFCGDVDHANALCEMFRSAGVEAASLTTQCPLDEREEIVERFRRGTLPCITAYGIPLEGLDTDAHAIFWLRPTLLEHLFQQGLGRVVRPPLNAMDELNRLGTAEDRRLLIREQKGDALVFEFLDHDPERTSERAGIASLTELPGDFVFDGKDTLSDISRYCQSVVSIDAKEFTQLHTSEQLRQQYLSPSQYLIAMSVHPRAAREASLPPLLNTPQISAGGALSWFVMGPSRYATAVIETGTTGDILQKTALSLTRFGSLWIAQRHEGRQTTIIGNSESLESAAALIAQFAESRNARQHHRILHVHDAQVRMVIEAQLLSMGYDRQAIQMLALDPSNQAERYEDIERYTFLQATINTENYVRSIQQETQTRTGKAMDSRYLLDCMEALQLPEKLGKTKDPQRR